MCSVLIDREYLIFGCTILLRNLFTPKSLYSEISLFRNLFTPKSLYSENYTFQSHKIFSHKKIKIRFFSKKIDFGADFGVQRAFFRSKETSLYSEISLLRKNLILGLVFGVKRAFFGVKRRLYTPKFG